MTNHARKVNSEEKNIHTQRVVVKHEFEKVVVGVVIILIAIYLWGMEKKHISFIDHVVKILDSFERLSEGIEHSTGWYWQRLNNTSMNRCHQVKPKSLVNT